jgi:hypothetical protein
VIGVYCLAPRSVVRATGRPNPVDAVFSVFAPSRDRRCLGVSLPRGSPDGNAPVSTEQFIPTVAGQAIVTHRRASAKRVSSTWDARMAHHDRRRIRITRSYLPAGIQLCVIGL